MTRWPQEPKQTGPKRDRTPEEQKGFFDPPTKTDGDVNAREEVTDEQVAQAPMQVKATREAKLFRALAANMRLEQMVFALRDLIEKGAAGDEEVTLVLVEEALNEGYAEACEMIKEGG